MAEELEKEIAKLSLEKEQNEYFIKNRKLFLWGGVDDESAAKLIRQLIYLDTVNQDDIELYINSPGGVISAGLAIYDAMQAIRSDVKTIVCGQAASMGAVLCCAGAASSTSATGQVQLAATARYAASALMASRRASAQGCVKGRGRVTGRGRGAWWRC